MLEPRLSGRGRGTDYLEKLAVRAQKRSVQRVSSPVKLEEHKGAGKLMPKTRTLWVRWFSPRWGGCLREIPPGPQGRLAAVLVSDGALEDFVHLSDVVPTSSEHDDAHEGLRQIEVPADEGSLFSRFSTMRRNGFPRRDRQILSVLALRRRAEAVSILRRERNGFQAARFPRPPSVDRVTAILHMEKNGHAGYQPFWIALGPNAIDVVEDVGLALPRTDIADRHRTK